MLRSTWTYSLLTVLTASALVACGDNGSSTEGSTSNQTDATDATPGTDGTDATGPTDPSAADSTSGTTDDTPTTGPGGETAADGEACSSNGECASQGCLKFRDLEAGECVAAPAGGLTRFTGTVVDFVSLMPVAGAEVRVLGALSALGDPNTATPVVTATTGANGQIDVLTVEPLAESVGVIGIVLAADYYTAATGLISPIAQGSSEYGPMNGNRDIWAVPAAKLTEWTGYLMADADIAPSLPLGEEGGVIGFVRDGNGAGKAGAKVISASKGAETKAKIRYLSEDGLSFNSDATASSGIFVLVSPDLAEKFKVEGGTVEGTAGSSKKAVFVMILTEP